MLSTFVVPVLRYHPDTVPPAAGDVAPSRPASPWVTSAHPAEDDDDDSDGFIFNAPGAASGVGPGTGESVGVGGVGGVGVISKRAAQRLYLAVMPLAERSLLAALRHERLLADPATGGTCWARVREVFIQVLDAVGLRHGVGLMHNCSPSNHPGAGRRRAPARRRTDARGHMPRQRAIRRRALGAH